LSVQDDDLRLSLLQGFCLADVLQVALVVGLVLGLASEFLFELCIQASVGSQLFFQLCDLGLKLRDLDPCRLVPFFNLGPFGRSIGYAAIGTARIAYTL
jgi:hypothetical protein